MQTPTNATPAEYLNNGTATRPTLPRITRRLRVPVKLVREPHVSPDTLTGIATAYVQGSTNGDGEHA